MAILHLSYVICDVCGAPGNEPTEGARSARFHAEASGFTSISRPHDNGRVHRRWDYCPTHRPSDSENSHA
jgi:hypothetical protein